MSDAAARLGRRPGHYHSTAFKLSVVALHRNVYMWLESRAEIINVSYRTDSATAPDRRRRGRCRGAAAAEQVLRFVTVTTRSLLFQIQTQIWT